jgi:hypothetical protein
LLVHLMSRRADYLRRIDLVQDLEFNTAATRMKTTPDGQYIIASGTRLQKRECQLPTSEISLPPF